MTTPLRTCSLCGEHFELHPKKPGLATRCAKCSGQKALLPREARLAHLQRRDENVEALFRNAIVERDQPQIEKWDKLRIIPFRKTSNSN